VLGFGGALSSSRAQDAASTIAAEVAANLANKRYAAVAERFTPEVAKGLPIATMERVWNGILQQSGAVREIKPAGQAQPIGNGGSVVIVPIVLERAAIDLKLTIVNDKVAGLFITPGASAQTQAWIPPAYVDSTKFVALDVSVGPTALPGTLTLPKAAGKVAAVVLIQGSGPNDRDESIGPNRPFRDIAEGLATRGIAALRYEKRTRVHPGQFTGSFTVREETMDDVVAAVALLASRPEIDAARIVIVGHSLGATLAPRIAEGGNGIAAIAILAGATRPLPQIMVEQIEYLASLNGPIDDAARQRIAEIKSDAARAMAAKAGDSGPPILGAPSSYWADLNAYDPAATAARLSLPILILQGGRDYQVTADELARFKGALAGHGNVTIREFASLNHLFMAGEGKPRPDEYERAGHVDPAAIDALAGFVSSLPK
jgi:dienelactone hydrolase